MRVGVPEERSARDRALFHCGARRRKDPAKDSRGHWDTAPCRAGRRVGRSARYGERHRMRRGGVKGKEWNGKEGQTRSVNLRSAALRRVTASVPSEGDERFGCRTAYIEHARFKLYELFVAP